MKKGDIALGKRESGHVAARKGGKGIGQREILFTMKYLPMPAYTKGRRKIDLYHMVASCCPAWLFQVPPCQFHMGYLGLVYNCRWVKN